MKKLAIFPVSFFLMIIVAGCSKETEFPYKKKYPVVITNPPVDLNNTGVTFSGTLLTTGSTPIQSYGFVWSWYSNEYQVRLDGDLQEGEFTFRVSGDLHEELPFIYQAFVETNDHLILGKAQSFKSKGDLPPEIVSFSPTSGSDGTLVTLIAKNLSYSVDPRNRIYVQNWPAEILSLDANTNAITFKIPEMEFVGSAEVTLWVGDKMGVAAQKFEVLGPVITGISKTAGFPGDELKIKGTFFTPDTSIIQVLFGSSDAKIMSITEDELTVIVPVIDFSTLADFDAEINVIKGKKTAVSPEPFRIWRTWARKASPPFDYGWRYNAFAYEGKGYILEMIDKKLYEYDPLSDQWTVVSSYPGTATESNLPIVYNQKLLLLIGNNNSTPSGQIWEYDFDARQWRQKGDMSFSFNWATSFQQDQKWYIFTDDSAVWTFDPESENFIRKNDFPEAFNGFAFPFIQDGEIMLITYGKNWKYQTATDSWIALSSNDFYQNSFGEGDFGFIHKDAVYVFDNGNRLYKYHKAQDEWRLVSQFPGCSGNVSYMTTFTIDDITYAASFRRENNTTGCSPFLFEFLY